MNFLTDFAVDTRYPGENATRRQRLQRSAGRRPCGKLADKSSACVARLAGASRDARVTATGRPQDNS
jgi:hypothetical protein